MEPLLLPPPPPDEARECGLKQPDLPIWFAGLAALQTLEAARRALGTKNQALEHRVPRSTNRARRGE